MENLPSTSSSSPATSRPSTHRPFDVFINHRGIDVKNTLASHIYYALESRGIRVFLDKDRMETGESIDAQIEDAIRNASVHVAIFSKNYAGSRWCLDELCLMMEDPEKILAVFYDVEPCDLRWTDKDGPYAKALKTFQEKGRFKEEWKTALFKAAGRSGCELQTGFNGDEGALLNHIVNNVLKRVKRPSLHVAKYPVGLDEAADDFEKAMLLMADEIDDRNVKVVGIVGMGGAGKTTLAKHFFNMKRSEYGRSSFLFDVRSNSLTDLQSKLLNDLTGVGEKIYNASEGIGVLKNRLSDCQALVVLDDIDGVNQLEALLVVKDVLRSDSLILVTSRDKGLLRDSQILSLYHMRKLDEHHARQLFCWHALLRPLPTEGFNELVERFLIVCDGLPLALQVLGALVYGKNIAYWTSQLEKISRKQERDIKHRLRVSYDALDEDDQEMFLDVACFFIGEKKDRVIRIWDGCGWNGLVGFHNLESKCLIEFNDEDCIRMHDQLRDMGRDIADEQSNKPRRLWRPDDVTRFHTRPSTPQAIRGIRSTAAPLYSTYSTWMDMPETTPLTWLDGCKQVLGICVEFFCRLKFETSGWLAGEDDVKLLVAQGDCFKGICRSAPTGLVWLRWYNCPYRSLPLGLHSMEQLRVLELFRGHIQTPWHSSKGIPAQLRELIIGHCSVKIPKSIEQLKFLEKLVLFNPGNCMKALPDEFCRLQSLKHLELSELENLELLPQNFGDLTNLQHLVLSYCTNLQTLPDSFSRLLQLRYLGFYWCNKLSFRQVSLRNILALEHADFSGCENLEVLPIHIGHQNSLETLKLDDTRLKELPNEIGDLRNLKVLMLRSPCLSSLPSSIWNLSRLTELHLRQCPNLKRLPQDDVDDPTGSRVRCLRGGFEHMRNLEFLNVQICPLTEVIPFTNVVRKLEKEETVALDSTDSSGLLPKLKDLWLINTEISSISIAENVCPNLTTLDLGSNSHLVEVEVLPIALKSLNLSRCIVLKRIPGLSNLAKLHFLDISECRQLEELPDLDQLSSLETFSAMRCSELEKLPNVSRLTSLKFLALSGCRVLKRIPGLSNLAKLHFLNISECRQLEELPDLDQLSSLEKFSAMRCSELEKLPNVSRLTSLKFLDLSGCRVLKRIPGLSNLAKLHFLNISECRQLEELPDLDQLSSLETFDARGCWELEELPNVSQLTSLKILRVDDCWKLKSIKGLQKLKRLEDLYISVDDGAIWNDIRFLQRLPHSKLSWTSLTTRAVPGVEGQVESIVGSLSSPLSIGEKADGAHYARLKVSNIKSVSAIMLCILFKASRPGDSVIIATPPTNRIHFDLFGREGEWIAIIIFTLWFLFHEKFKSQQCRANLYRKGARRRKHCRSKAELDGDSEG